MGYEPNLTVIGHETKYEVRTPFCGKCVIRRALKEKSGLATGVLAFAGNAREYAHTSIPGH